MPKKKKKVASNNDLYRKFVDVGITVPTIAPLLPVTALPPEPKPLETTVEVSLAAEKPSTEAEGEHITSSALIPLPVVSYTASAKLPLLKDTFIEPITTFDRPNRIDFGFEDLEEVVPAGIPEELGVKIIKAKKLKSYHELFKIIQTEITENGLIVSDGAVNYFLNNIGVFKPVDWDAGE